MITILAITNAVAIILFACACERLGYWKHEATENVKHVRYLERQLERSHKALQEARAEIADDNVIISWQRHQISGHIRDTTILMAVNKHLESGKTMAELTPADVIGEVESWLAGEDVVS